MSNPSVHEVGRVTGARLRPFSGGRGLSPVLRLAVVKDTVSICIGIEGVQLDARMRAAFERLYRKAKREAEAYHDGGAE